MKKIADLINQFSSFLSIGDQRNCCASCALFCVNNADTKLFFDGNTVVYMRNSLERILKTKNK